MNTALSLFRGVDTTRSIRRGWIWLCVMCCTNLLPLLAQTPGPPSELVDEVRLPLEKITPELLPNRIPVPLDEYQVLKRNAETARNTPAPTRLLKAHYTATYSGHLLSEGTFSWTLQNATRIARTRPMEPLGLSVRDLKWGDQPAVWGTSPAGRLEVLLDRPLGELQGLWELSGKTVGEHDEFVVQVPTAVASHITLQVPVGHVVTAVGQAVSSKPGKEGFTAWEIVLGGRSECQIVIHQPQPAESATPLILVQHETLYALRQEGLRLTADLRLEVTNSAVREIPIWADPDLEIFSITYGNDIPLPWQTTAVDGRQRLLVQLPDALRGPGRTLRLRGVAPLKSDVEWKLPNVAIAGAALVDGHAELRLMPPLQLQELNCSGYRQVGVETSPTREDLLTFKQFRTDGVLSVKLGKPQPRILARVLSDLQTGAAEWNCFTQLQLTGAEGAAFSVACRIPAGWDVIDVRDPQAPKLDWSVTTTPEGQRLLSLQFLEAVTPDKVRIIEIDARHSATSGDQTFPIPAFEPLAVDDLSMLVAVNSAPEVRPVLESGTSFEPCEPVDLDVEWVSSKFWKTPLADRSPVPLLLRLNGTAPEGQFSLQSLQTPIEVVAEIQVQATADKLTKNVKLQITPRHGKTERVLVYHSEPGPQLDWTLAGATPRAIEARKLPISRHAAWDLPTSGELWELRLPQPQSAPFELEGVRVRGLTPTGRLGLVFVPQAQAFRGRVSIEAPSDLGLELTAWQTDSDAITSSNSAIHERVWSWHLPTATLRFQTRVATELTPDAVVRRIAIQGRWTLQPNAHDYYVAQLELGSGFNGRELRCTLPTDAEVTEVKIDGQPIPVESPAPGGPLVLTNVTDEQLVTIAYRARSRGLLRPMWRTLLLPKLEIPVLRCDVELLTPSGFRLGSEPRGMVLKSSTPSTSTLQRLFGPLGRSSQEVFFNPLSPLTWAQSWSRQATRLNETEAPAETSDTPVETSDDFMSRGTPATSAVQGPDLLPVSLQQAGWKVWRGSAAMLPDRIDLWLWSHRQATGTAWLGFWICLLLGITLRLLHVSPGGSLGMLALTVEILLAIVLPPVPAQVVGGCLAGTILALLWPQRLMRRPDPASEQLGELVPQGSTRTYLPHSSRVTAQVLMLVALGLCGSLAFAQPQTTNGNGNGLPRVLIPVDANNKPLGQPPLAYVPERLVKEWNALQSARETRAAWLIKSGEYILRRDATQQVGLTARYEVTVLSDAAEVEILFPLTGINFGGPAACLVNGEPHPVLTRADSTTLVIRVPGVASGPAAPPMPEAAEQPAAGTTAAPFAIATRTYRVEFQGYPIIQSVGNRQWMELTTPRLHAALWTLQNDHPEVPWTNRIGDTVYSVAAKQSWPRRTGPVTKLRIEPSPGVAAPSAAPVLEARLALLADVQPAVSQLHYQVSYRVTEGQVANVAWRLPAGLAVRSVTGPEVFDWHLVPSAGGTSQLQVDLQSPVSEGFLIKVEALLPNDGPPSQITILPVQLLTPTKEPLRPMAAFAGIRTTSEFQGEAAADAGEQIAPATVDEFVNEWGKTSIELKPQVAYSLLDPVPLKIGLRSLAAQRVVRMNAVGVLGSRRLLWNLNATIEVQTAAAYSHQLEIDSRLNVTGVSIQEDAANRLLRWTRTGDVLHVFLRDKTTGTQTLTLQGTMPTQVPQELALPTIKFADATVADARLQLYQEPDLEVELADPDKWERLEVPSELRMGAARNLLVGRFKWQQDAGPFVVRAAQNEPVLNYSAVTSLQPRDGRWKLTTNLLFEVLQGHGSQFSIRVPPELPLVRVDAADVRQLLEREPDGGQRIVLIPQAPVRGRFVVQVSGEVNLPTGGTATIPEILGLNAARTEHFVVLPADAQFTVDPRTSGLTAETLPAELAKLLPTEVQGTTGHQYRGTAGSWTVTLARHQEDTPQTGVLWSETQIWCGPTNQIAGRTSILLGPQENEQVDLTIPAGVELQGVLLDGEFVPHASPQEHRLLIPLTFPQAGHALTVYWTQGKASFGMLFSRSQFHWPRVAEQEASEQYVTLTPPPGFRAHTRYGEPVERIAAQLSELQALLQLMRQRAADGPAPQDPQWLFLHRQAASLIRRLQAESRLQASSKAVQERFARLNAQFQPWEQLAVTTETPEHPEAKPANLLRAFASLEGNLAGPHSLLVKLEPDAASKQLPVSFIDESVWRWMLGLSMSALVLCLSWPLLRWKFPEWLAEQPAASWALLGVIWWYCLTPSWLGMVWLTLAAVYSIRPILRPGLPAAAPHEDEPQVPQSGLLPG